MRKNAKLILAALLLFCVTTSVNAEECDYSKQVELNTEASTVKAVYEETEIDTGMTTYDVDPETDEVDYSKEIKVVQKGFNVKVMNITKNLYLTVSDDTGNVKNYYHYDANDGTIILGNVAADEIHKYTIEVGAYDDECSGKTLRTINLITPIYNEYSELGACNDYPEFQYCQKYFTTVSDLDITKFQSELENYKKKNKPKTETNEKKEKITEKVTDFIKRNLIVIVIIIAILGVATSVILVKRKRSRLI
ncbi:MAG: hypothetical protein E7158_03195 [Firmicutes bacterium]|nr:hypothetical protein [Bacillota bacterium]